MIRSRRRRLIGILRSVIQALVRTMCDAGNDGALRMAKSFWKSSHQTLAAVMLQDRSPAAHLYGAEKPPFPRGHGDRLCSMRYQDDGIGSSDPILRHAIADIGPSLNTYTPRFLVGRLSV